jgi:Ni/Fe-hydrogenase subunit HybB-like protein
MRLAVAAILFAFLAGAVFVAHYGWVSAGDVTMPPWGWLMMALGILFSLVVGCGLMILVFYSSRAGFDEAPTIERKQGQSRRRSSQN